MQLTATAQKRDAQDTGLLTVLIPNHNYGRYIAKAIDSIARQDYGRIELIVIDDGSCDDSVKVAEASLSRANGLARTELLVLGKNRGKLGALNAALSHIHGEYLITLDADDWLAAHYASRCISVLNERRTQDPSTAFVYTDCHLIDANETAIDRGRSVPFDRDLVGRLSFLPEPGVMLTHIFTEVMPFDESIRVATKHHKWTRVVANGWSGFHIAEPLFFYRMHERNLSGIGNRVLTEHRKGQRGERILSGYWQLAN